MKKITHLTSKDGTPLHSSAGVRIAVSQAHIPAELCLDKQKNRGQENFASDPCELAFICVLRVITCVPINACMISSMRVITYECELNLPTRLPQNFLDPYEV